MRESGSTPLLPYELDSRLREGHSWLAGIDEAGRGPVAGPMVTAGVVLPHGALLDGVTDSKCLSDARRRALLPLILETCVGHSISIIEASEIDRNGMAEAVRRAFSSVAADLGAGEDPSMLVAIDGLPVQGLPFDACFLCKGDRRSLTIAAASIVAKVTRDDIMIRAGDEYPAYDFPRNKGYLTPGHLEALRRVGPCPIHRRSFSPVSEMTAIGLFGRLR
ncbi:ribonuclease HII [Candidatus Fermentibacterales bacterium]|nr:ribonuclease HII [Candidatus Fermentibacterales bacterium]